MTNNKQSSVDKDFVPYKQALALKELGFDEPCFAFFQVEYTELLPTMVDDDEEYRLTGYRTCSNLEMPKHYTSAPLYQQAFRWFREKFNLHHEIEYNGFEYLGYVSGMTANIFKTYEEAELACLRKLIEIVKEVTNESNI
jgi:hypothetical protein